MTDSLTLAVRGVVDAIEPASRAAEDWLQQRGMNAHAVYVVNLAIEELVTNCIRHGYDDALEHSIDFVLSIDGEVLTIVATDDGREFDASSYPAPDIAAPAEQRSPGGLGIHLLREFTDTMSYERRDGRNRLTLTKRFR